MFFSHPQKETSGGGIVPLSDISVCVSGNDAEWARLFFAQRGFDCTEDGSVRILCTQRNDRALTYIDETRSLTDEKYILETEENDGRCTVRIFFSGRRSLYYALCDLARQLQKGALRSGRAEEYPLFAVRGYIEGFYGAPWTPQQRIEMLREMAAFRMNTYYYAPKDDPYHREKWAQPYPPGELDALRKLVSTAQDHFVDFWFCIAPGLDIVYSDARQFAMLMQKCRQVFDVGVRRFGLLLDDIAPELADETDKARYGDPVEAHIDLAQRFADALRAWDSRCEVTLCPMQYHGRGDEYYISKLGCGIDPIIRLFWTGYNICSQELTVHDAIRFEEHTRHAPLYWDNFPVNDAEMAREMHLGYCFGREPDLYRYCRGLIANCMPYCACSRIPLRTIADYLWNPVRYDPIASWEYALYDVVGNDAPLFRVFAEHLLTSCLHTPVSPDMCGVFEQAQRAYREGDRARFLSLLSGYSDRVHACLALLQTHGEFPLYRELQPWVGKFARMDETLCLCVRYVESGGAEYIPQIRDALRRYTDDAPVMADFAFQATIEWILSLSEEVIV